jgi:hypothetical protein
MFIIFFLLCIVLVAVIVKRTVDAVFRMECKVDQIQADIDFIVREIERLRQQSTHNAGRYPKAASRLRLHPAPVTRAGPLKRLAVRRGSNRDSARRLSSSRDLEQPLNQLVKSADQIRSKHWSPHGPSSLELSLWSYSPKSVGAPAQTEAPF